MKAVYFPFTYISEKSAKVFASIFGKVSVYQVFSEMVPESLKKLSKDGLLGLDFPVENGQPELVREYSDLISWGSAAGNRDTGYLSVTKNELPFFNETSIGNIRSEISCLSGEDGRIEQAGSSKPNPYLFLQLAQELDLQNDEINSGLKSLSMLEDGFMEELRGEGELDEIQKLSKTSDTLSDPGAERTRERIECWNAVYNDAGWHNSDILVTDSHAVIDYLKGSIPLMKKISSGDTPAEDNVEKLPAELQALAEELYGKINSDDEVFCGALAGNIKIKMELFFLPGELPGTIKPFCDFGDEGCGPGSFSKTENQNTLICYVEY